MRTAFAGGVSSLEDSVEEAAMTSFCMESCRGFGLLNGGASTSVGGVDQLQTLQDALLSEGLDVGIAPATQRFAFAGANETTAGSQCVLAPSCRPAEVDPDPRHRKTVAYIARRRRARIPGSSDRLQP